MVSKRKLQAAHQLTLSPSVRQLADSSLERYYENDADAQKMLQEFFATPPASTHVQAGQSGQIRFVKTEAYSHDDEGDYVAQFFELEYSANGKAARLRERNLIMS